VPGTTPDVDYALLAGPVKVVENPVLEPGADWQRVLGVQVGIDVDTALQVEWVYILCRDDRSLGPSQSRATGIVGHDCIISLGGSCRPTDPVYSVRGTYAERH
jgi:hypothetical protein